MKYKIVTVCGDVYICDKDGYILEYSSKSCKTWQITGAWYSVGSGHICTVSLQHLAEKTDLYFENGKPRYGLTNIDHNAHRLREDRESLGISKCVVF